MSSPTVSPPPEPPAPALLLQILGSVMDAIIMVDESQRVLLFNAAAEAMFGRSAADTVGQPLHVLLPGRYRSAHGRQVASFARTAESATPRRQTVRGLRADGEEFPIEISMSRFLQGGRVFCTVIARDLTAAQRVASELESSTQLLRTIVNSSDDAIIGKTLQGVIISWNPGAERLFGYTAREALGQSMQMLMTPDRAHEEQQILERIRRGERVEHFETTRIRKDGRQIEISATISPLIDPMGRIIGASKIARDITEQKSVQRRLLRLGRTHAVLSGINYLIVRTRDRHALLEGSCRIAVDEGRFGAAWIGLLEPGTRRIASSAWTGPDRELMGAELLDAGQNVPPEGTLAARAIAEQRLVFSGDLRRTSCAASTQRLRALRAINCHSAIALPLIVNEQVAGVLELFAVEQDVLDEAELALLREMAGDISFALEHIADQERLRFLDTHDPLTGLANRTWLLERTQHGILEAARSADRLAVVVADIKGFRAINQGAGRHGGDALLRAVGHRLRRLFPDTDKVARLNADVFAFILNGIREPADIAHRIAVDLDAAIELPYEIEGESLRIVARIGVAMYPTDGTDADTLFRNAETALSRAKATGERLVFYQPAMNAQIAASLVLESRLKNALARGEFALHYQPKVEAAGMQLIGLEALIRWKDPQRGLIPPGQFVPLLEESGLIVAVGRWALQQALQDHASWSRQGLDPPRIAVNVSAVELRREDFVEAVRAVIGDQRCEALDLEITESVLMDNLSAVAPKLMVLREMGFHVAIDDFGTGYSSLSYLGKLPISTVKIDLSFVRGMTTDPDSMTIVSTIISLAHSLGLRVVAEGVETEEQARYLRLLRCDELQGYLFGRPLDAQGTAALLAARPHSRPLSGQTAG